MNKKIISLANKKFNQLKPKYSGFINVGVDDWHGYRFIFDTEDVRRCKNNCFKCPLYILLKDRKEGRFSAGLYLASKEDKALFGPQKYLNCKTLRQYQNCYINFLVKRVKTGKEIKEEFFLIKNFQIIFSKETLDLKKLENNFKKTIIKKVLKRVDKTKKKIIRKLATNML